MLRIKELFSWADLKRLTGVVIGAMITALSLNYFIVPNRVVDGGVTGIAILIYYVFKLPVGWVVLALNIPIFLLGLKKMGGRFLFLSAVGVLVVSLGLQLTAGVTAVTRDLLLASIFGGLLTGIGMGLIFRSQGSLGGTDIIALIVNKRFNINIGQILLAIDAVIFTVAAVLFNKVDLALYAVIYMFVATRVIDFVQDGLSNSKAAVIISDKPDAIANDILNILERGVTFLPGSGAYSGEQKKILYCVISRTELARVKEIVHHNDPAAFMTLSDATEVLGEGFKQAKDK